MEQPRLWFDGGAAVRGKRTTESDVYILIATIGFEGGMGERWRRGTTVLEKEDGLISALYFNICKILSDDLIN